MRDTSERLRDIQEAIIRIERYAVRGRAAFDQDELIQNWIVHHLQIIGEAITALPEVLGRAMEEARQIEVRALQALAAARDAAAAAEWALHEGILGARVLAQYGPDSNAIQMLGLKKKSERKRPVRRVPAGVQ